MGRAPLRVVSQTGSATVLVCVALALTGCGENDWEGDPGVIVVVGGGEASCSDRGRCKCPDGHSVIGADAACGDGSGKYFTKEDVADKGCTCAENKGCPAVTTQTDFDLDAYIAKPWYILQQMETEYLEKEKNFCVTAMYTRKPQSSALGYTISVRNRAYTVDGVESDSGDDFLMAYAYDKTDPAKLAVAPWFVPKWFSGEYWVLAHNETMGYALISGGQPKIPTPYGCRMGSGTNDAGLWIFSRTPEPDWPLVEIVRGIAEEQGFDLTVLNDVSQANCTGLPNYPAP